MCSLVVNVSLAQIVPSLSSSHPFCDTQAFQVHYDSFACNLDHNNVTVYLHGLPNNQSALFSFAKTMETTIAAAGWPINHPRKSLFHMTLARVNRTYPTDTVVNYFLSHASDWDFGEVMIDSFTIGTQHFVPNRTSSHL